MENAIEIIQNHEKKRFEIHVEGKIAFQEYIQTEKDFIITHTEVPQSLEGRGLGSLLAKNALEYTEKAGLKMMPLCPFMATYIAKHREYEHLLTPGFNV
ncbi:GNAT family N-acetyltransferase [Emticicia sp. SJ17W-69]|uniref:GNAT family N-acetyltransferase n=1 Tax=Emticicia sp. SJ17W-69 TaxID=3421657 RepID=UPI003EB7BC4D